MLSGVGLSVGPFFGSYLYYFGGYKTPFIFFSIAIFILIFFLKKIEIKEQESEIEENCLSKLLMPVNN